MVKTKNEMIEYWLKAGIDLSGLNVQYLGVDSKDPEYLKADVYLLHTKSNSFDPRDSDIKIDLSQGFPLMRTTSSGEFESSVYFLSPYGKISIVKIHNHIYCYMESPYGIKIDKANKAVHLKDFLNIAQQNFHMRNLSRMNSGGIGC